MLLKYKKEIIKVLNYALVLVLADLAFRFLHALPNAIPELYADNLGFGYNIFATILLLIFISIIFCIPFLAIYKIQKEKVLGGILALVISILYIYIGISELILSFSIIGLILIEISILYLIMVYKNKKSK